MSDPTTSDSEEIACPGCGAVLTDLTDYHWRHSTVEVECDQCDRKVTITRQVSVDYTACLASSTR